MTAWLLAWLWQGVALAVSLSIALHLLPRVNAATRYVLWWGAFIALVCLGWQSFPHVAIVGSVAAAGNVAASGAQGGVITPMPLRPLINVQPLPPWALSLIGMVWVSVALFHMLRIFPGLNALYRLKGECRPFPRGVEEQLPLWLETKGRRVRLMLCDRLPGAAVLGLQEPCIAIPSSLVSEMSATDLDQIILHEYGHVQRRDDWMRLLQTLVQSALWMHPAAFLIGRELNLEREVACDDWVIARTGSPARYAGCLSRVAEQRRARVSPAFAQALFAGNRDLCRRVDRLLDAGRNAGRKPSLTAAVIGAALMAVGAIQLAAFPLVVDALMPTAGPGLVVSGVPGPSAAEDSGTVVSGGKMEVAQRPRKRAVQPTSSVAEIAVRPQPDAIEARADSTASVPGFIEPSETPMLQGTRVFEGVYQTANVTSLPTPPTPWRRAGNAGVGIGTVTRKASVGLANRFAKAGTAVARSF